MYGELNGNIFRSRDGHIFYKRSSDIGRTKLYYQCAKYRKGCRMIIYTNYTDKGVDHLRVIHTNGSHNHGPFHDSHNRVQSLSTLHNHTRKTWETPHAE